MTTKTRIFLIFGVLTLLVGSGLLGLRGDGKWIRVVDEFNQIDGVAVPIEGALSVLSLQQAFLTKGIGEVRMSDMRPAFIYDKVEVDGKTLSVLSADTDSHAREGTVLTMGLMEFLHTAADDPKAEGIALNRGDPKAAFRSTLTKAEVQRLIEDLKVRGRPDVLPRWNRSEAPLQNAEAAALLAPATAAVEAPQAPKAGLWRIELLSYRGRKIDTIKVVRELTGLGLKDAMDLVDSAPITVKQAISEDDARRWKAALDAAGAKTSISALP